MSAASTDFPPYCYRCATYHWGECPYPYWTPTYPYVPNVPNYVLPTPQYGWICPRCLKVWAPSVTCCDCPVPTKTSTTPQRTDQTTVTVTPNDDPIYIYNVHNSAPGSCEIQHDSD